MRKNKCISVMLGLSLLMMNIVRAQSIADNVVIITLDGFRWQELFKGVDTIILNNPEFTRGKVELEKRFGAANSATSRERLMPFFWSVISKNGLIAGNREQSSFVNNSNPYWFSYPGYNELLTGFGDSLINANDKKYNHNVTVLEAIHRTPGFDKKVAAFATWDVFPFIINAPRSGVFVNAGMDSFPNISTSMNLLTEMQHLAPQPIGVRPDVITYLAAKEYLKLQQPNVLYIAFDETDDYAHSGMYHDYLKAAHAEDAMIADLWHTLQTIEKYKDKTTLIITTDHGRGDRIKSQWKDHGQKVIDASEVWVAMIGPGVKALGENVPGHFLQGQVAASIAHLLGISYQPNHPVLPVFSFIGK